MPVVNCACQSNHLPTTRSSALRQKNLDRQTVARLAAVNGIRNPPLPPENRSDFAARSAAKFETRSAAESETGSDRFASERQRRRSSTPSSMSLQPPASYILPQHRYSLSTLDTGKDSPASPREQLRRSHRQGEKGVRSLPNGLGQR